MKNILTKFFCIICFISASAQDLSQEYLNTLEDEELLSVFNEVDNDSIKAELVARTYLSRGRKQNDTIKMARAYDRLARIFASKKNISYADSIIDLTINLKHKTYPAIGYMIKGYEFNIIGDLVNSTKNFHILYDYSISNDNIPHQWYALNFLIRSKSYWGNELEALMLQKNLHKLTQRDDFIQKLTQSSREGYSENVEDLAKEIEIVSIYGFIFCYLNLKDYIKVEEYINLLSIKVEDYQGFDKELYTQWLVESELELSFYLKKFKRLEIISENLLSSQLELKDASGLFDNYGFRGLANFKQNKKGIGLSFLLKADSIYDNAPIKILPYRRRIFEELHDYYQFESNDSKQIEYLNKLIKIDSVLKINYQYFEPENIKKIETPQLLLQKEIVISRLKAKNRWFKTTNWLIAAFLVSSLILTIYYFRRQRIFRKRFEALLSNKKGKVTENMQFSLVKSEISTQVIEHIMNNLDTFEKQKHFLSNNLSLQGLAKKFNTNSNYLSRVINLKMEKNFSQYIHDLRIEYSMNELLSNSKFRNYTIKAIAEDCGYTNAESYSRAFYKKNGIYPSYYIKKLNQTEA